MPPSSDWPPSLFDALTALGYVVLAGIVAVAILAWADPTPPWSH